MTTPPHDTVSVVIPVKDDAAHLEHCLEALWAQTRRPDQIVVVDNGSSDLTAEVAAWWRVVYVYEGRAGIAAAAAAGYDAASGDLIARLDADSIPTPDWVAGIEAAFADPRTDAVTGPGRFDALPPVLARLAAILYMAPYFGLFGRMLGHPPLFGSNFAMRRGAWQAARRVAHREDPEVHDDLDLSFSLPRSARVVVEPRLALTISARPFADPVAFVRRIRRGAHTVAVNEPELVGRIARTALLLTCVGAGAGIGYMALSRRRGTGPATRAAASGGPSARAGSARPTPG